MTEYIMANVALIMSVAIASAIIGTIVYQETTDWIRRKKLDKPVEKTSEHVECDKCGVLLLKLKAGVVKSRGIYHQDSIYYCKTCMPKYDETCITYAYGGKDVIVQYYKTERFEVDENGKRIAINK